MKLSEILNINSSELDAFEIFDTDFSRDRALFIDPETIINSNGVFSEAIQQNLGTIILTNMSNAVQNNDLKEIKHWGLGFATNTDNGSGPDSNAVTKIVEYMTSELIREIDIQYLTSLLENFGPDGLSDLMIIVFEDELNEHSNKLISFVEPMILSAKARGIDIKVRTDVRRNKIIQYISPSGKMQQRRLLSSKILSRLDLVEKRTQLSKGEIRKFNQLTEEEIKKFDPSVFNSKKQFVEIISEPKTVSDFQEFIKMQKIAQEIIGTPLRKRRMLSVDIYNKTKNLNLNNLDIVKFSSQIAVDITPDFNKANEKTLQNLQAAFLAGLGIPYNREPEIAGGKIEFKLDAPKLLIEDKLELQPSETKLLGYLSQIKAYLNDVTINNEYEGHLVIFTSKKGFEEIPAILSREVFDTFRDKNIFMHIFRKPMPPSKRYQDNDPSYNVIHMHKTNNQ